VAGFRRHNDEARSVFSTGIETHEIEPQPVRVFSVAKMLADLFKSRNLVGLEVAVEALREAWRNDRFTIPELDLPPAPAVWSESRARTSRASWYELLQMRVLGVLIDDVAFPRQ
jgi:hypothetical protein